MPTQAEYLGFREPAVPIEGNIALVCPDLALVGEDLRQGLYIQGMDSMYRNGIAQSSRLNLINRYAEG